MHSSLCVKVLVITLQKSSVGGIVIAFKVELKPEPANIDKLSRDFLFLGGNVVAGTGRNGIPNFFLQDRNGTLVTDFFCRIFGINFLQSFPDVIHNVLGARGLLHNGCNSFHV